ncbi:MAG TPA: mechanosensitive ion channel domain-containing protein, partial [Candidatus Saccharimonadia bacterium]|nr:mechanosensitive ion channel domain-containing protein [Candidatus Saccharimonadia bacterium]
MPPHRRFAVSMLVICLLLGVSLSPAQTPAPTQPTAPVEQPTVPAAPAHDVEGPIRPETVTRRKDAVQKRLEMLEHLLLSPEEAEAMKVTLAQQVKVLAALEAAFQKSTAYTTQLETLPHQVEALNAERQKLAVRPPQPLPEVNEKLRLDYETRLQSTRAGLDGLRKELTAGEFRLGTIAKEIEQRVIARTQIEKDLLALRNDVANATEQTPLLLERLALFDLRQQLQQAEIDMLEGEREWLTKQGPLLDAQLGLAQTRYAVLQQDLDAIKAALGQVMSQESVTLTSTEEDIVRRLLRTTDSAEMLMLKVQLETIKLRQSTAAYRQQVNLLGDQMSAQEKRNEREQQEAEHLESLVKKYARGERIAQRLQAAFTRIRRVKAQFDAEQTKALEVDLDALTEEEIALDEQLYEFDHSAETRLRDVAEAQRARVQKVLDEQKAALRERKQSLDALVQEQTKLLTLRREYKRILEEGDRFVLAKLFWLRDGQTIGRRTLRDAVAGAMITANRVQASVGAALALIPLGQAGAVRFWVLVALAGIGLPWVALWGSTRLRSWIISFLATDSTEAFGTRSAVAALIVIQTAIWPAYLMLVAWAWPRIIVEQQALDQELSLLASVQWSALVLWGWLVARALLRPQGWMQRYWGLSSEVRKALQQTVTVGCLATLVFLVPRHILVHAPGGPEAVAGSLALARLCFTAFQIVLLGLVLVMGRRGSQLMTAVLTRSREAHGVVWRYWPLVYLIILAGVSTALGLDLLGYNYASQALWLKSGEALLILLALAWVDHAINTVIDRLIARQQPVHEDAFAPLPLSVWTSLHKFRPLGRVALGLLAFLVLEHVYGISAGLLSILDHVHVFEVGRTKDGELLWLTLKDIAAALLILVGTGLFVRCLPSICDAALFPRVRWDAGLRYTFLTLSRYAFIFLGLWWGLSAVRMNWSSIQWIVAAVSVGVGFGLQEIVSNFVSGLILLVERPIRVDDIVTVGDQTGTVKRITIRATAIQNADNQTVIIPNKEFIARMVTNWTLGDTYVRLVLSVGVAYGSNLDLVQRLLTETVGSHPRVLTTPPPAIFLRAFGDHALQWEISCFVPRPQDRTATAHDLLLQIDQVFRQHAIAIPFPQQDVHLRSADATLVIQP